MSKPSLYQRFVDLISGQTVGGSKTFSEQPTLSRGLDGASCFYRAISVHEDGEEVGVGFGVGNGGWNRGIYDMFQNKWMIHYNQDGDLVVNGNEYLSPPGTIAMFAGSSIPNGWLLCNGAAVSRTEYARLFNAVGTSWGSGDGSATFNLPDGRGRTAQGANSSYSLGASIGAGIPDVYGNVQFRNVGGTGASFCGAFGSNGFMSISDDGDAASDVAWASDTTGHEQRVVAFRASSASSVYGSSSSVQSSAVAVHYMIKT